MWGWLFNKEEEQEMNRMRYHSLVTMFVLSLGLSPGWAENGNPSPPGRDRYLLLNSRVVASIENAKLVLGKVQKYKDNHLFEEDKPWEKRFDNLYANVIYDDEEHIYKCCYSPFIVDNSSIEMTPEQRKEVKYKAPHNREMAICFATSQDGINWIKPELGLVEFGWSKANNILWRGSDTPSKDKSVRISLTRLP